MSPDQLLGQDMSWENTTLVSEYSLRTGRKVVIKHVYETYLHEYGHYDQSIGAFSSFCIICVELMIVVDQLNLEHTERGHADT